MIMGNAQSKWCKINVSIPAFLHFVGRTVSCSVHSHCPLQEPWPPGLCIHPLPSSILLPVLFTYPHCCLPSPATLPGQAMAQQVGQYQELDPLCQNLSIRRINLSNKGSQHSNSGKSHTPSPKSNRATSQWPGCLWGQQKIWE